MTFPICTRHFHFSNRNFLFGNIKFLPTRSISGAVYHIPGMSPFPLFRISLPGPSNLFSIRGITRDVSIKFIDCLQKRAIQGEKEKAVSFACVCACVCVHQSGTFPSSFHPQWSKNMPRSTPAAPGTLHMPRQWPS